MKSLAPSHRLALSTLLLACAPAFAASLSGTVQDASGRPVAGALVVGNSSAGKDDANGAPHRWVATTDGVGRFTLPDFPPGPCHVTANADAAGSGQERDRGDARGIAQALPHLKAAADRGEIAWATLALLIDRDLTDRHKPQVYGSQATVADGKMVLLPVQDAAHLDERRAQVGLGPEADYLAQLQKLYLPAGTP